MMSSDVNVWDQRRKPSCRRTGHYGDNGKENGNYRGYRDSIGVIEVIQGNIGFHGIMEKKWKLHSILGI